MKVRFESVFAIDLLPKRLNWILKFFVKNPFEPFDSTAFSTDAGGGYGGCWGEGEGGGH